MLQSLRAEALAIVDRLEQVERAATLHRDRRDAEHASRCAIDLVAALTRMTGRMALEP